MFFVLAALVVSVIALVVRFARSAGEERQQLKWFAAAAVLVVATLIVAFPWSSTVTNVLLNLAILCLWVAVAIAVLKYRLYDIDIVISKTVQYGSLAVFITAVYAALVAGIGTLAGNRRSPLLAALAAAVVAVAFQPVRQWAGRLASRVVYGRRATPYQVLSAFARRIGGTYSSQEVLPQMAQTVAAGTGAEQVVVWLRVDDQLRPEASSDGSPPASPHCPLTATSCRGCLIVIPACRWCTRASCWARSRSRCPKTSRCARRGSSWSPTLRPRPPGAVERGPGRGPAGVPAAAGRGAG